MLFEKLLNGPALAAALILSLAVPAFAQDVAADQGAMPADAPRIADVFPTAATEETTVTPEAAEIPAETPFDGAMRQISAAQTACDEGTQHLGEGADRATVPACVAYDAMQTALWDHAVQVQEVLLAADLAGHVTTRANADRVRDDAMAAATTAANALAAVEGEGDLAFVTNDNTIAAATAAGALAAEQAANALEAEEARNPVADVVDSVAIKDQLAELKSQIAILAGDVLEGITYNRGICATNPGTSWCPN